MKIALICPSNIFSMPYVISYEKFLKDKNINYVIINWDRLQIEEPNNAFKYRDKKKGHQRKFWDYVKYKKFVLNILKKEKFDKVIIFTLQLSYFFKDYLMKQYKEKYILDIRDYNKIFKFYKFKKLIDNSSFTVISSPGYKMWLPKSEKYVINHNTTFRKIDDLEPLKIEWNNKKISIYTIGIIRHWDVNINLVNQLKNNEEYKLIFHGEGTINDDLKKYVKDQKIKNVQVFGRYNKEEEKNIYKNATLINIMLYDDINSKGVLANRLYNSVVFGKPMLTLKGTYLADQVEQYNLGLVLDSFEEMEHKINNYLNYFNADNYEKGRVEFFQKVIEDNNYFFENLHYFSEI